MWCAALRLPNTGLASLHVSNPGVTTIALFLSTVYAPCEDDELTEFFAMMDQAAEQVTGPWVILGDFNMYRFAHEKSQGRKIRL